MHNPEFKMCSGCESLQDLYNQLECTIVQLMKNRWTNVSYASELYFNRDEYRSLLQAKKILEKKLANRKYATDCVSEDVFVGWLVRHLYRTNNCLPCPCKDFTDFFNTTTSSTTSSTTTTPPPVPPIPNSTTSTSTTFDPGTTTTTLPPVVNPPIACGEQGEFQGGSTFPSVVEIILGSDTGTVTFDYNAFNIPDKFIVYFDGVEVINTGYRGNSSYQAQLDANLTSRGVPTETIQGTGVGNDSFNKNTATTSAFVYVWAPLPSTAWNFTLNCPS